MSVSHPTLKLDWLRLNMTEMSELVLRYLPPPLPYQPSPSYNVHQFIFPTSSPARYIMSVSHPTLTLDWFRLNTTHMSGVSSRIFIAFDRASLSVVPGLAKTCK